MKTKFTAEILGNVGQDSTFRQFDNGKKYLAFSVAHNTEYTDTKGNKVEKTSWISVLYQWSSNKEIKLEKGTAVLVRGNLQTKLYKDQQGQNQIGITLNATDLSIIGKIEKRAIQETKPEAVAQVANQKTVDHPLEESSDDLPF